MKSLICFLFFSINVFSQNNHSIAYQVELNKLDYFSGFEYRYLFHEFQFHFGFQVGINRTFFQNQIFPKFSAGFTYDFVPAQKCFLGAEFCFSNSFLTVLKSSKPFVWNELVAGIRFEYGENWKFVFKALVGPAHEYQHVNSAKFKYPYFAYQSSLGLAYAFH